MSTPFFLTLFLVVAHLFAATAQIINPAELDGRLAQLAAEAAARGPAAPIPLQGNGARAMGSVYDQFLTGVVLGRRAIASGQAADGPSISREPQWRSRVTTVVAYPVTCDGKPNRPVDIRWKNGVNVPVAVQRVGELSRGPDADALPGVTLDADALVIRFSNALMTNATIEIDYAGPWCQGGATMASFPIQVAPSRAGMGVNGVKFPAGFENMPSPTTVRVMAQIDLVGKPRFMTQRDGPAELGPAAIAALESRTFEPSRINGAVMPLMMSVPVVFTSDGAPGRIAPSPLPQSASPGQMAVTSTVRVPVGIGDVTDAAFARLAVARAIRGAVAAIPLNSADGTVRGWLLNDFLIGVIRARAAMLAGTPFDASAPPASLVQDAPLAVVFPLRCGDRMAPVTDVDVVAPEGSTGFVRMTGPALSGSLLASRLPAFALPDGAVARSYVVAAPMQNVVVRVTYGPECDGQPATVPLPVTWSLPQAARHVSVFKFPPEAAALTSPITVQVRGIVDETGQYQGVAQTTGPRELEAAAVAAPAGWNFTPARANGIALPAITMQAISFNATGPPASAVLGVSPPLTSPAGVESADGVFMSSSVNGRSTEDFRTPDVSGLSAVTSRCDIADNPKYGTDMGQAIGVGGGNAGGPAREVQYLAVLRGPNGEATHVVRRGSLTAPNGTILDLYEVVHVGQVKPLRLYLDEYHSGPLKAPMGLVCAAPLSK